MTGDRKRNETRVWRPAPLHPREDERLAALRDFDFPQSRPAPALDRIAALASRLLEIPHVMVVLVDDEETVCHASAGGTGRVTGGPWPRDESLCGYTILGGGPLLLRDLAADPDHDVSPALQKHGIRFYLGVPLVDDRGLPLGSLCLLDEAPRDPSPEWIRSAVDFAAIVQSEMAIERAHRRVCDSVELLRRSERRYTDLVATVPGAVFRRVLDPDGRLRFTFVSEGIRDICGLDADECLRLDDQGGTMVHPDDHASFDEAFRLSARSLEPVQWQGRLLSCHGGMRWVQTVARPEVRESGEIHWSGIATSVDALKEAEGEIREMNRTLESKVEERTEDLHRAQLEILMRLGKAAEARDDDTGAHIARVARVSGLLARGIGMGEEECAMIRQASPMHDIGKISVPDAILMKPGRLTPAELAIMQRHAAEGARMLEGGTTPLVRMAETIARTHHERWDGTGYPERLAGEAIPLVGRIVAIADVFDALTSERPYKRAWALDEAVAEIRRNAGLHFDPALVEVFLAALPEILRDDEPRLSRAA